jgi:hypothetical protein
MNIVLNYQGDKTIFSCTSVISQTTNQWPEYSLCSFAKLSLSNKEQSDADRTELAKQKNNEDNKKQKGEEDEEGGWKNTRKRTRKTKNLE